MGKGEKSRKNFGRKNNGKKSLDVSGMGEVLSDPRFAHIASDPKFHVIPKKQHKIALDSRFSHVFEDERFHSKSAIDPRGRPCNFSTREDLHRFYSIASDEDSGKSDDESDIEGSSEDEESSSSNDVVYENASILTPEDTAQPVEEATLQSKETSVSPNSEISPEISEKLANTTCDYARGEAMFTDDSSDDDSSTTDEDDMDVEFEWGELDCDAEWDGDGCDFEETSRFAVCNMDWDRVKAADLMALFASFVPYGGSVTKVTIYPSEFGLKRMAEDEVYGPHELTTSKSTPAEIELRDLKHLERGKLDLKAGATPHHVEAVRRYQRNRMKYYYAVVACDSVGTAAAIYKNCDRHVFEGAGVCLDLRYIPDDMTFDQTPHDVCEVLPENYDSKLFFTTAVTDSKPTLTWDETDLDRTRILSATIEKALKKKEFDDEQVKAYLASSGDDDSDIDYCNKSDFEKKDVEETKEARIAKFRALVAEIDEKERKKIAEKKAVSFEEGDFDEKDAKLSCGKNRKSQQEHCFDLTPFEKYLDKKEKKKVEKLQPKSSSGPGRCTDVLGSYESESNISHESENEGTVAFPDDDVPDDVLEDPYFESLKKKTKTKKASKHENKLDQNTEDKGKKEELELLLMNEEMDEERHFSMQEIIRENKIKNMKNKKRKKKLEAKQKDRRGQDSGFKVNVDDPRFSALLTSADYSIDPSHPHFKRTAAMDELIKVLQKKRRANHYEELPGHSLHFREERENHAVSRLVNRIKTRTKKAKLK